MTPPAALPLSWEPRSVHDARRWAVGACLEIGRPDLVETSELGVSELVTNALLHAESPLQVRLGGTVNHPRIEVHDGSPRPPAPRGEMTDEQGLLSTVGRGLGLVSMCSVVWGARVNRDGKVVWFVPAPRLRSEGSSAQIDFEDASEPPELELEEPIPVRVLGLPPATYRTFRRHYAEVRRELRLLTLASESSYAVAGKLSDLFQLFDEDLRLRSASRTIQEAIDTDADTVDVQVIIDRSSVPTVAQMLDVIELADAFCRAERLLTVAPSPVMRAFSRWYLGEFLAQARGRPPQRWVRPMQPEGTS